MIRFLFLSFNTVRVHNVACSTHACAKSILRSPILFFSHSVLGLGYLSLQCQTVVAADPAASSTATVGDLVVLQLLRRVVAAATIVNPAAAAAAERV